MTPSSVAMVRAGRLRWLRWPALAVLLPLAIAVHAAVAAVVLCPLDPASLAPDGGPLVVTDRDGAVLATLRAPGGTPDRAHWVPLADIPAIAVSAVLESEDHGFWDHRGVDGRGVARALWLDVRAGKLAYGGSTLTMQLARLLISPGEGRTIGNKLREALLALRIERALGKRQILEQWMNRAYFGRGAYGIDAAARLFFGKPASALSTAEVVLLACLPRAPRGYDPIDRLPAAIGRRDRVLALLVKRGVLSADDADRARRQPMAVALHPAPGAAPHFVRWVAGALPPDVRARGGVVRTSLDGRLQALLEQRVAEHVASMGPRNLGQAGVVVLDTATSQVLAMVGSAGWDGDGGQINITTRRRHPGSALKPFVYAAAIEAGDHPSSIAFDIVDAAPDYFVPGAAAVEHGPVRYREALASSYNFAAIDVLEKVGIPRVMSALAAAGVATLDGAPDDYGLRLALGAPKVRLVDLAAGYGFLVRGGTVRAAGAVLEVESDGGARWRPTAPALRRVFSATTSWLVMDMLSDPEARRPAFGDELPLDLPFRVAAKTGTSRGFQDTVAVAATREVIAAAWAGNFDGTPTQGVVAMDGAAPLVRAALLAVADGRPLTLPDAPDDIVDVEVCARSGQRAGPDCPRSHDHAARGHEPDAECTWHRRGADGQVRTVLPERAHGWQRRQRR
jgi:penicillin-binding protein 1C